MKKILIFWLICFLTFGFAQSEPSVFYPDDKQNNVAQEQMQENSAEDDDMDRQDDSVLEEDETTNNEADEENSDDEAINKEQITQEENKSDSNLEFIPNNANTTKSDFVPNDEGFSAKTLFPTYVEVPQSAYANELIPLKIRVVATRSFETINLKILDDNASVLQDLTPDWTNENENVYLKTIYIQIKDVTDVLPDIEVSLQSGGNIVEKAIFPSQKINIIKLNDDDGRFIGVIAKSLIAKKVKTTAFDEDNLIMVIEFIGKSANLLDMNFQNVVKQGIDSSSGTYPDNSMFYFIVFQKNTEAIEFSYFNVVENKFNAIKLPVVVEQDTLSTQIDLDPKKSHYELYKDIGLLVLVVLCIILYYFRKKSFYAFLAVILCAYMIFFRTSMENVKLKSGTKVRILPTEKSTFFYNINDPISVEKLNVVGEYIKVSLPNGKIGWVKKEDVLKN